MHVYTVHIYSLLQIPDSKELKLVITEEEVNRAEEHASACFTKGLIPVLEAEGTEVAQSFSTGLLYCDCLKPVPSDFTFTDAYKAEDDGDNDNYRIPVKDNKLIVIKLKESNEYFATSSLRMQ